MRKQNYSNHVRYYSAHHFVFYPLLLLAMSYSIYSFSHYPEQKQIWLAVFILFCFIGWLSFMLRQHYALGNQDRIIRLEMRLRYFVLTGNRLEPIESSLSFRQLAALRFASDEELPTLAERAVKENLSSTQIKKFILEWMPDTMRV